MLAIGMPGLTEWFLILFIFALMVGGVILLVRILCSPRRPPDQRGFEVKTEQNEPRGR